MARELRELSRKILYKGKETQVIMTEMLADENDAFVTGCTKPTGVIDQAKLWELRLARTIKTPAELATPAAIRETTAKERGLLKAMWIELNQAVKEDFLDLKSGSENDGLGSILGSIS